MSEESSLEDEDEADDTDKWSRPQGDGNTNERTPEKQVYELNHAASMALKAIDEHTKRQPGEAVNAF